ncbi:hypothetical protein ACFY0B_39575 [Streptomyces sp. NPDC001797]
MLETPDARLAEAHGGELGHLDFLWTMAFTDPGSARPPSTGSPSAAT